MLLLKKGCSIKEEPSRVPNPCGWTTSAGLVVIKMLVVSKDRMKITFYRLLLLGGGLFFTPRLYAQAGATVVDSITTQYQESALSWILSIQQHAENLFWILAAISAV